MPVMRTTLPPSSADARADVLFIVPDDSTASPFGKTSPRPSPSWHLVAEQLARRLPNYDERIRARVATQAEALRGAVGPADVVIALACTDASALERAARAAAPSALICHGCAPEVSARVEFAGTFASADADAPLGRLLRKLAPWSAAASGERLVGSSRRLLSRLSSEDTLFAVLLLLHKLALLDVELVRSDVNPSWEKGPLRNALEFAKMIRCCGPQIFAALTDSVAKRAIDMLTACDLRDQVGSYRVIVSFESALLEDFSLCILQQNNCFACAAPIMTRPAVPLLKAWRGAALDARAAAQIMVGHLAHDAAAPPLGPAASGGLAWSWKIVCGANPAYDAFPAQHQLFYPPQAGSGGGSLWYDPVFLVETLDGALTWCKRHYRCTPRTVAPALRAAGDSSAGAWTLSTLDNGIVSVEHWTTVDAADDLSWCVLHYSGAARAAGQSYAGALLCSADGRWPAGARSGGDEYARIERAFGACGLQMWELYGHGPPEASASPSYMWTDAVAAWAHAHPPPLEPIGDISVSSWRKTERERLEREGAQQAPA
jgi:hypothetical protein